MDSQKGRSTQEPIFILRQTGKNVPTEETRGYSFMFYRFKNAFDRIRRNDIWKWMRQRGVEINTIARPYTRITEIK
jgi:hypothetical protein